jgi:hypothetical protein
VFPPSWKPMKAWSLMPGDGENEACAQYAPVAGIVAK